MQNQLGMFEEASAFTFLKSHASFLISGPDCLEFVHGQVSNDVKGLSLGGFHTSLMLNHKGHALAQMQILRQEEGLLLVVEDALGELVRKQLEAHIIFDQVVIKPELIKTVSLQGLHVERLLETVLAEAMPQEKSFVALEFSGASLWVLQRKRSKQGGVDLYIKGDYEPLLAAFRAEGASWVDEQTFNLARVSAGIPTVASEAGPGVLPQEAGLDDYISYHKGCYLGQEIMARIEARGKLKRSLQGLRLEALPSEDEKTVTATGKSIGHLGQVVLHPELGFIALAVLKDDPSALFVGDIPAYRTPLPFEA